MPNSWSIENEWPCARDANLCEAAHRYANRIDPPLLAFLRTVVMNLLGHGGYRAIRQGLRELATTSRKCLHWDDWSPKRVRADQTFRQP